MKKTMIWNEIELMVSLFIFNYCQDKEGHLLYSKLNGAHLAGRNWVNG